MATVAGVFTQVYGMNGGLAGWKGVWSPMLNGDVGTAVDRFSDFADKSIQATGAFGVGGSVAAEGSNDGINYFSLTDPQGTVIAVTAAGGKAITEATLNFRPHVTAGDGTTSLTVTMFFRRTQSP